MTEERDPRQRAIALLESQHAFPGVFEFRVVIRPPAKAAALGAVLAVTGGSVSLVEVTERPSSNGNYVALRISARVAAATRVLDAYEVLRGVEGVLTVL
jgi:putative lipoic acid-binding regulatory protein